jgi:hypothetical protein
MYVSVWKTAGRKFETCFLIMQFQGTDVPGTSTGFIDPAFISGAPIYVLQSQCKPMDSVTVHTTINAVNFQKGKVLLLLFLTVMV